MMTLFNFRKRKDAKKTPVRACSGNYPARKAEEITNGCCLEAKGGICCIKVLGTGCKSCRELYENAEQAVEDMGLSAEVEYTTDMREVMKYGVMSMPALVVDEKVIAMGKVLTANEVVSLLRKSGF